MATHCRDCWTDLAGTLGDVSQAIAAVLASALAAGLVLVQPWAGRRRYRRLVAALTGVPADRVSGPRREPHEIRLHHYRRAIVGEWTAVGVIVVIGLLAQRSPSSIGLRLGPRVSAQAALVAEVAVLLGISAAAFRFGGPKIVDALRRQARGFLAILPRGRQERVVFAALAVTAGICEELIIRGFGISYLRWLWPGAPRLAVIVVTAAVFGFAHLYQGLRGVVLTGLVGAYLAWLVLTTGSLLPAMVIHALLDLRILALPDLGLPASTVAPPPAHSPAAPGG